MPPFCAVFKHLILWAPWRARRLESRAPRPLNHVPIAGAPLRRQPAQNYCCPILGAGAWADSRRESRALRPLWPCAHPARCSRGRRHPIRSMHLLGAWADCRRIHALRAPFAHVPSASTPTQRQPAPIPLACAWAPGRTAAVNRGPRAPLNHVPIASAPLQRQPAPDPCRMRLCGPQP
jgi:hypothetical protein